MKNNFIHSLGFSDSRTPGFSSGLPSEKGYFFPAEFAPHEATWLSWPHKEASWPGKIDTIYPNYS
ncbi:agmatine deiminase family protein, partial [Acinetobacter baumannii]